MSKRLWATVILVAVGILAFAWFGGDKSAKLSATASHTAPAHIMGKQGSPVSLVEYGDFQCSACAVYFPVVEQVVAKYQDRISFEFRQYPLVTVHQNAFAAARAAEAASRQGKFWQMYRLLYSNQAEWASSSAPMQIFSDYAGQLGINANRFATDFASSATNDAINASIKEFNDRGLPQSTPTFLLNGKKIEVVNTVDAFSKLIDAKLAQVK